MQWHIDHDHNLNNQPEKAGRQHKADQRTGPVFCSGRPSHVQSKIASSMILIESRMSSTKQAGIDEALMKLLVGKVLPLSLVHPLFHSFKKLLDSRYIEIKLKNHEIKKKIEAP